LVLLLVVGLNGCFICGADHEDLLVEHRKHLVEKVIPNYADALQNARTPDGAPLYILEYKHENLGLTITIVESIDRVLDDDPSQLPPLPWQDELDKRAEGESE